MILHPTSSLHSLVQALVCLGLCTPLLAQAETDSEPEDLPALSAASEQASVVGVSSGGYMATQLAVAWPERFSGLGVLAAGPWSCAQGSLSLALNQCMMTRRGLPSLDELEARHQRYIELEQVGSAEALSQLRAYLWHGEEDEVVEPQLGDLLAEQWQQWLASPDQLRVARSENAGHGWPIRLPSEAAPGPQEWGDCRQGGGSFLLSCDDDIAGEMLDWLYPERAVSDAGEPSSEPEGEQGGELVAFDQSEFAVKGLADTGYVFIPEGCDAAITYMNRQCPAPSYPTIGAATATTDTMTGDDGALSRGAIPPAEIPIESSQICMTTLTDAKSTSRWQRFIRWRNFDGILELTHANKALYAHKHGYRFVDGSDWIDTSRPPAWSKIPAVQHLLQTNECEWVLWTDADTVIMNSDVRIQDFLPAAGSGKDLMVGSDNGGGYNSGVFLVRNTPWAQEFLQTWWDMRSFVRPSGLSLSGDNNAMKALLREMTDFNEHVLSPPRCTFNAFAKFLTLSESVHVLDHLDDQEWYLSENYYHKGDFIAHTPGYDNKAECLRMLLQEAR